MPSIRRSRDDRIIAGVLGGFAAHFGWSPTRLRIAYIAVSVVSAGFPGIVAYAALWFLIPSAERTPRRFRVRAPMGLFLLGVATTLTASACGGAPAQPTTLSAAEVDALHHAMFGVPASGIVQPDLSHPVDRNLRILRARLDGYDRREDVERNLEILRRRIDPPDSAT